MDELPQGPHGGSVPGSHDNTSPPTPVRKAEERILSEVSRQHGFIDGAGKCITCGDNDSSNTALQCVFCRYLFHAVCKDFKGDLKGKDVICCRTFFDSFENITSKPKSRHGHFLFSCNYCLDKFDQKSPVVAGKNLGDIYSVENVGSTSKTGEGTGNSFDVSELVSKIKGDILGSVNDCINKKIEEMTNKFQDATNQFQDVMKTCLPTPDPKQPTPDTSLSSYSSVVGSSNSPVYVNKTNVNSSNNMKDVLILSPIVDCENVKDANSVKNAVSDKLKSVPFDIPSSTGKTGNIAIRFPNRDARDSGTRALSDGTFLNDLGYNYSGTGFQFNWSVSIIL